MASFLDKDGLEYLWNKIKQWIPKKTSDIQNDSGFITNADVPSKTSDLTNDSGFISTETDPTVPAWAKEATKPSYTAAEVGASEAGHTHDDRYYTESEMDTALAGKSDTSHTHDDRYYTESEMDTRFSGLIDIFYPVGSYYETSDTSFDPNTAWGGTWIKDSAGRVTVALDSTQAPFDTIGETGGTKDAIVPYHNHGFSQATYKATGTAVTVDAHGITQPTFTGPAHNHEAVRAVSAKLGSGTLGARIYAQSGTTGSVWMTGDGGAGACTRTQNVALTNNHKVSVTQPTISINSNGSVNYAPAGGSGNATNANLQPYVVVYRWHRTA